MRAERHVPEFYVNVILTNDDGYDSPGMRALEKAFKGVGRVITVAPNRERSAVSNSITLRAPVRMWEIAPDRYKMDGTPADCVYYAYLGAIELDGDIDLVVSGVNRGPNLAEDVLYSGTVAGAAEGCVHGIPSIAVSSFAWEEGSHFTAAAKIARQAAELVISHGLPRGVLLNINCPKHSYSKLKGIEITRQGHRDYHDLLIRRTDPWGNPYFWIGHHEIERDSPAGSDYAAIAADKVSITPCG